VNLLARRMDEEWQKESKFWKGVEELSAEEKPKRKRVGTEIYWAVYPDVRDKKKGKDRMIITYKRERRMILWDELEKEEKEALQEEESDGGTPSIGCVDDVVVFEELILPPPASLPSFSSSLSSRSTATSLLNQDALDYMLMMGDSIKMSLKQALSTGGAVSASCQLPATPLNWRYCVFFLSPILGQSEHVTLRGVSAKRYIISSEEQLQRCCSFFGPSFYSYDKVIKSLVGAASSYVGTIRVSFFALHRVKKHIKKPATIVFRKGLITIRCSFAYRIEGGFLCRGCDGMPDDPPADLEVLDE